MSLQDIVVQGAHEHNLRGVNVTIPRLALTTITGVSGSGKSSLAFDTIYQEGQRRYVESLSAYARQFLGRMEKPKVERIDGLSPTLLIDQKTVNRNPRSTVGTITEIYDHLRLLFARIGIPKCPECGVPVRGQGVDEIANTLISRWNGRRLSLLAPVVRDRKGEYRKDLRGWRLKGYSRAWIDGVEHRLDVDIELARNVRHTIELVVDRLRAGEERRARLAEGVEAAARLANGQVRVRTEDGEIVAFSTRNSCPEGHGDLPDLEPRLFSFNSPQGACGTCQGLGLSEVPDPAKLIEDERLSIRGGALRVMDRSGYLGYVRLGPQSLQALAQRFSIDLDKPWKSLPERARQLLLRGSGTRDVTLDWTWRSPETGTVVHGRDTRPFEGLLPAIARAAQGPGRRGAERFLSISTCPDCDGARLGAVARSVTVHERNLPGVTKLTIRDAAEWCAQLPLEGREALIGRPILKEVAQRLGFLESVGVGYLSLERSASTLSGGESQRVRLASQVGSGLQGVLYVLDEPSIGLHARDNQRLIDTLHALRDRGNTVLVVEHDEETIRASDTVVDIGPGAGPEGGRILGCGPLEELLAGPSTPTTDYLSGRRRIECPASRRPGNGQALTVVAARQFNLHQLTVRFPLGCFVAVTGVSGSGKSTLVDHVLKRALARRLHRAEDEPGAHEEIQGIEHIDKVIEIDQSPIGRTPRSNPATYTGLMDLIREVFASTPEARVRGYGPGRFSFNVKGGRCEGCEGAGVNRIEMQFLADVEVPCEVCEGRRYNTETRDILTRGRSIDQVLELTVHEAAAFFEHHRRIARILTTLQDVGLGYMRLGQTSTTLSGGEAQRMKLASELCRPSTGRTLYLLDEPTTGLHFEDVRVLLAALQRLVEAGNSLIVVEHNLDVIKSADWVVDLGPEGGRGGGRLVAEGTPEQVAGVTASHTGQALARALAAPHRAAARKPARAKGKPPQRATSRDLEVRGATLHNLKSVAVRVPHGQLTVITGPSGSGKTSLAFDTIFAEGQRRYVESLSTYARRFLDRLDRPPLESISGLAPAIAIDQRTASRNPRSTVATTTEIHDHLRMLWARVGQPHCWTCGRALVAYSPTAAIKDLLQRASGQKAVLTAPLWHVSGTPHSALSRPEELGDLSEELRRDGFVRVLIDGAEQRLDALPPEPARTSLELVVDRVLLEPGRRARLTEAIAQAQARGLGLARVRLADGTHLDYPVRAGCVACGHELPGELSPRMFSFNSHVGACDTCEGLGQLRRASEERLIDRPDRPLLSGALTSRVGRFLVRDTGTHAEIVRRLAQQADVDLRQPWARLPARFRALVLRGEGVSTPIAVERERSSAGRVRRTELQVRWEGLLPVVEGWWRKAGNEGWWQEALDGLLAVGECPACHGGRLKPAALATTVAGHRLQAVLGLTVSAAHALFSELQLDPPRSVIAKDLLREIVHRLGFLANVGVGYLTLDRAASSLSGGEAQRIRLASQLGNRLVGVLYVLDEPSIGLHPRDQQRLIGTLCELRDLGNTILVVEHDRETIEAADQVIDMGPGAGVHGGSVVAAGTPRELTRHLDSLTGQWLSGRRRLPARGPLRTPRGFLQMRGAEHHNLRSLDVELPLGLLTVVTGVSGSGKSTLVADLLVPALRARLESGAFPAGLKSLEGGQELDRLLVIDQAPLGRSGGSNAATYSGAFDDIRAIFADTPEARMRGFAAGRFSLHVAGGRCEACQGRGVEVVEMHFLSDIELPCEACGGKRYQRTTLEVRWKGHSIAEVLELDVEQALALFSTHDRIRRRFELLRDVGLGYLKLGQPATTLSGGEAQRVKLATELGRPGTGRALIVLDEPTTGLHFEDVARLLAVLQRMVEQGNTVVIIEHNPEVMASADWIVDLGPEGGDGGGRLVVAGTPAQVAAHPTSHTGRFLKSALERCA
ncbi:MAG: excinuclease ABC subunit UvrA [Planctomycetota bacterium]